MREDEAHASPAKRRRFRHSELKKRLWQRSRWNRLVELDVQDQEEDSAEDFADVREIVKKEVKEEVEAVRQSIMTSVGEALREGLESMGVLRTVDLESLSGRLASRLDSAESSIHQKVKTDLQSEMHGSLLRALEAAGTLRHSDLDCFAERCEELGNHIKEVASNKDGLRKKVEGLHKTVFTFEGRLKAVEEFVEDFDADQTESDEAEEEAEPEPDRQRSRGAPTRVFGHDFEDSLADWGYRM